VRQTLVWMAKALNCLSLLYFGKDSKGTREKGEKALPNIVVEWLALLVRIREVPGSNLGLQTGYPD
jgi:hypothetical protein